MNLWLGVLCGLGCVDPERGSPDDASTSVDTADAGAGDGCVEECIPNMRECEPPWERLGQARVEAWFTDPVDVEHEMEVVSASDSDFRLSGEAYGENTPTVDARFPPTPGFDRPSLGERVIVRGARCYLYSYVRITTLAGELVWEGGDPACEEDWSRYFPQRLGVRRRDQTEPCWFSVGGSTGPDFCCCPSRRLMDVLVRSEPAETGGDVLAEGEEREIMIGGRTYLARSQGAYDQRDGRCTWDATDDFGSAFLARLRE